MADRGHIRQSIGCVHIDGLGWVVRILEEGLVGVVGSGSGLESWDGAVRTFNEHIFLLFMFKKVSRMRCGLLDPSYMVSHSGQV